MKRILLSLIALTIALPALAQPAAPDPEQALLLDLRKRRVELDAREAAMADRAKLLAAMEQRLAARLDELKKLQEQLEAQRKEAQDQGAAKLAGLVKMFETMKPKEAAAIMADQETPLVAQLLGQMKDAKAAAILAALPPDKARGITARLAQTRTARTAS